MPSDKKSLDVLTARAPTAGAHSGSRPDPAQWRRLGVVTTVLVIAYCVPLWQLARFASGSELYSYMLLLPFVSVYLVWMKKPTTPGDSKSLPVPGALFVLGGAFILAEYWLVGRTHRHIEDRLAFQMCSLVLFFFGACCICLGRKTLRISAIPIGMMLFMIPAPVAVMDQIDLFLQYSSAYAADLMFSVTGMTFIRTDLIFRLPGVSFRVAPECSGIHSSLILLITSVMAGYLFLRSPWKRVLFSLVVLPLGILRNGFRIFVLGELSVHLDPAWMDSWLHHHGGPIFFVLSLVPMFILLLALEKSDRNAVVPKSKHPTD